MKILISLIASMVGFFGFSKSDTIKKSDMFKEDEHLNFDFDFEVLEEPFNSTEFKESPACLPAIICIICTTLGDCPSVICPELGGGCREVIYV